MAKTFLVLNCNKKAYKLEVQDISRLYRITKRKLPALPAYRQLEKPQTETDAEHEAASTNAL